jgi:hypothetical protein
MLASCNENLFLYTFSIAFGDNGKVYAKDVLFRIRIEFLLFSKLLQPPQKGIPP